MPDLSQEIANLTHPVLRKALADIADLPLHELELGPDAQSRAEVPHGTTSKHRWESQVFAGTVRDIWIHVPHGHTRASPPAKVMVFQDGNVYCDPEGGCRVTNVLDNLIARGELPPMVAIFVSPGGFPPATPEAQPTSNRSVEYDTLSDHYARMLVEEVLPFVAARVSISDQAADRGICGISSGGICSFLAAWYRPDVFSRVLSHVGSFADIRGGHHVPSLVRKSPKKPIRVLLQGCTRDIDNEWGNWWLANLQMESALRFKGYDHAVVWSPGAHSHKNGAAILPQCLRWLWRP